MKIINVFCRSVVSVAVMAVFGGVQAADNARNGNRSMMPSVNLVGGSPRMPVQNVTGLTVVGNPAVTTTNVPVTTIHVVPTPQPQPDPEPDPEPTPVCPDGGIENSEYTAAMCRKDILNCINAGALPGGLNDLYSEEVRNAVLGGMRLCQDVVDKCIKEVRENCKSIYVSNNDVWMDFNCRVVQPEYYNFVLYKTGLTPNQAENTCLLLDRNTYGSAFAAVSDKNEVNTEYNNAVGAYNRAENGTLSKKNPQGVEINTKGYDGNRGHYARWDASKAECLIRVGAYNKDKQITNSWLFGAVGNDNVAEVWQKAGSAFTCNKDLFGFSLLNDTKTAAVIGIGGGTVLGASIGAAAGAGVYNKKKNAYDSVMDVNACEDDDFRASLIQKIVNDNKYKKDYRELLRTYLWKDVVFENHAIKSGTPVFSSVDEVLQMTPEQCRYIVNLKPKIVAYKDAMTKCEDARNIVITQEGAITSNEFSRLLTDLCDPNLSGTITVTDYCTKKESAVHVESAMKKCLFKPLQVGFKIESSDNPLCEHDGNCVQKEEIEKELATLESMLGAVIPNGEEPNKAKEIGKGLGIGAATGAGAGGLATMITAFVERSHITCKVGDGLNSIAFGKSYSIDSLKDFYVKWNLHLPDSAIPNGTGSNATYSNSLEAMCFDYQNKNDANIPVVLENTWVQYCHGFGTDATKCKNASVYYKTKGNLVNNACVMDNGVCVINKTVFNSVYSQGDS